MSSPLWEGWYAAVLKVPDALSQLTNDMYTIPVVYRDERGSENISMRSTGSWLRTIIRGVTFDGRDFDSLVPAEETDLFDFYNDELCGFTMAVRFPVRLSAPEGVRHVEITAEIARPPSSFEEYHDSSLLKLALSQPEFTISTNGRAGIFEDELLSLVKQLPADFRLEACITCGLSDYNPAGSSSFGNMFCFRDVPDEYRLVKSKDDFFDLSDRSAEECVQETHYCDRFETRPAGRGYRG